MNRRSGASVQDAMETAAKIRAMSRYLVPLYLTVLLAALLAAHGRPTLREAAAVAVPGGVQVTIKEWLLPGAPLTRLGRKTVGTVLPVHSVSNIAHQSMKSAAEWWR